MRILYVLVISAVLCSCLPNGQKVNEPLPQNQTPEVFEENVADVNLRSFSKRYGSNIIEELYQEAMDKDKHLDLLNTHISDLSKLRADSLKMYQTYKLNNERYWNSVDRYLAQLTDSTLRHSFRSHFDQMKKDYEQGISSRVKLETNIEALDTILRDQHVLLKLMVTAPMMKNYQSNELPSLKPIENIITQYDTLIEQSHEIIQKNH